MEKSKYIQPQTYVVNCTNMGTLLAGSGDSKNITGNLPGDNGNISSGGASSNDYYDTSSGDAKKYNAWDSWDD